MTGAGSGRRVVSILSLSKSARLVILNLIQNLSGDRVMTADPSAAVGMTQRNRSLLRLRSVAA